MLWLSKTSRRLLQCTVSDNRKELQTLQMSMLGNITFTRNPIKISYNTIVSEFPNTNVFFSFLNKYIFYGSWTSKHILFFLYNIFKNILWTCKLCFNKKNLKMVTIESVNFIKLAVKCNIALTFLDSWIISKDIHKDQIFFHFLQTYRNMVFLVLLYIFPNILFYTKKLIRYKNPPRISKYPTLLVWCFKFSF